MRLWIDTNILLDVLLDREPFVEDSLAIWKLCESRAVEGDVSTLSFANMMYVIRKKLSPDEIRDVLRKLSLIFCFVELSEHDLLAAVEKQWKDFEDAIQASTAERVKADYILTRNGKDFAESSVPVLAPSEFLTAIISKKI